MLSNSIVETTLLKTAIAMKNIDIRSKTSYSPVSAALDGCCGYTQFQNNWLQPLSHSLQVQYELEIFFEFDFYLPLKH